MLNTLAVAQYRSLRELVVPLAALNLVTGENGSGKSNLYRSLRLLAETARGGVVQALAREGGIRSTLWAGPESLTPRMRRGEVPVQGGRRHGPVSLRLGFASDDFGYAIDLGLPAGGATAFALDPEIKREVIWHGPTVRAGNVLVDRRGPLVRVRDARDWRVLSESLPAAESLFDHVGDFASAPEVVTLRERIRGWRFYDHFRTDADAPARLPQLGTRTPVLSHDGRDLAAAWQTVVEIGDRAALAAAVDDAFPGASVGVELGDRLTLTFRQSGLLRPLTAGELSDGTLRYLLWIAALHTPRPPQLMVLNEPETSLHPDLLPALGRLIADASKRSQVWVVSHAPRLIAALEADAGCNALHLEKALGETRIAGQGLLDAPAWQWPAR